MQRTRNFVWALNHDINAYGWLVDPAPAGWYSGPGFLAAHDTMEHLSDKPDWAHELRATGVGVYGLRGAGSRTYGTIAEDVIAFASVDHAFEVPEAPPLAHKRLSKEHELRLEMFVQALRWQIAKVNWDNPKIKPEGRERAAHFPDRALPWIRLGYRGAMRVYGADRGGDFGRALMGLRDAINQDHDFTPPIKGDRLRVTMDSKTLKHTLTRSGRKDMSHGDRFVQSVFEGLEAEMAA